MAAAARVLGSDHGVTRALAKAVITMAPATLWRARLEVKTLRIEQRRLASAGLVSTREWLNNESAAPTAKKNECLGRTHIWETDQLNSHTH